MRNVQLCAQILVAVGRPSSLPTLAAFIESIAPTFADATATTYWPYWRLAIARFGDRPVAAIDLGNRSRRTPRRVGRCRRLRRQEPTGIGRAILRGDLRCSASERVPSRS